ncbi:MAG: hypothetical protein JNK72_11335 [Myxococcales bacterium]|nr:hypothetical protein [Myxococcales bacterium]
MPQRLALALALSLGLVTPGTRADHAHTPRVNPRGPQPRPSPGPLCSRQVRVRGTQGAAGCWIDERVTRTLGLATWPCDQDGPASVRFGASTFDGEVRGGQLRVTLETRFHYGDGCDWVTQQHIEGAVAATTWRYRYSEAPRPRPGQRCANACAAEAVVEQAGAAPR